MPYRPAPWEIAWKNRGVMQLFPDVICGRTAEKKCQKRAKTRENGKTRASILFRLQAAAHAQLVVLSGNFSCCSFLSVKVSQKCSQVIHMRLVSILASGLEIRNQLLNRQEKNEFYFSSPTKICLTKKRNAHVRAKNKMIVPADLAATRGRHRSRIAAANCSR
jgi:hypothetical protein